MVDATLQQLGPLLRRCRCIGAGSLLARRPGVAKLDESFSKNVRERALISIGDSLFLSEGFANIFSPSKSPFLPLPKKALWEFYFFPYSVFFRPPPN